MSSFNLDKNRQANQADQQKVAEITQFLANDPQIQQWKKEYAAKGYEFAGPEAKQKVEDYLSSKGMHLPDGYVIQQNGTPVKDAGFDIKPLLAMAALVSAGTLGPVLFGGGAAGSAGSAGSMAADFIDPGIIAAGGGSTAAGGAAAGAAAAGGAASDLAPLASGPLLDSAGGEVALNTGALVPGGINPAVGGVNVAAGTAGDQLESLMGKAGKASDAWNDISKTLGTFADTNVNNQRNLDRDRIAAQAARNTNESDALRKLMVTNYLTNQTHGYQPPTIGSVGGKQIRLPDMGAGFLPPSAAQREAAGTLEPMLKQRLAPGGSVWPEGPSTADNIANAGSLITSGLGTLSKVDPNWMSQAGHLLGKIF